CVAPRCLWVYLPPRPALARPLPREFPVLRHSLLFCACFRAFLPGEILVCPLSHTKVFFRHKNSLQGPLAFFFPSIMFFLPANILPFMITGFLGSRMPSAILAGVILLWSEGSYPVAAVIFLASIMVPTLKMIAIAWLCWDAKGHGKRDSERMH
ncbi:paraquat-inducible protein A, partial [Salmonella enterica]|uniref:paraquat-inducible protein A n=1 Tax=Salmonella enterica TaxID=28901 RepID=UPI000B1845BE